MEKKLRNIVSSSWISLFIFISSRLTSWLNTITFRFIQFTVKKSRSLLKLLSLEWCNHKFHLVLVFFSRDPSYEISQLISLGVLKVFIDHQCLKTRAHVEWMKKKRKRHEKFLSDDSSFHFPTVRSSKNCKN
jgi:hypothetical protein